MHMTEQELFDDIRVYCRQHADPKNVQKYSRYFKEGFDAYGLTETLLRDKVREFLSRPDFNLKLLLRAAPLLLKTGKYEETSFAILLLNAFAAQVDAKTFKAVEKWFSVGIINWAHCDVLCGTTLKEFMTRRLITLDDLSGWRTAANKHQRRAVPVAMLNLLKTTKDVKPPLKMIEPLMMDPEEKVQQGLGWFLREAWKLRPEPTETFLLKWKDLAPRKIYQYATEKMSPEDKLRFKKQK
jgi:3-methyladenine DNA glycosylase AlkD